MTPNFDFLFLIRLSVIWSLLLLFYSFFLRKNDTWSIKRSFILAAYILGLILPFLPTVFEHAAVPSYVFGEQIGAKVFTIQSTTDIAVVETTSYWDWPTVIMTIYLTVCFLLALRVLRSFLKLRYWLINGKQSAYQGYKVIQHPQIKTPMAGFNTIFMPANWEIQEETEMACFHEKTHLQRGHQWERLPLLIGHIFLWFHPLQWLFQHLQEQIQEYEVDEGVLQRFSLSQYGRLLIQASMAPTMAWHPNLFSSPLKNRINMMSKIKNKQSWRIYHTITFSLLLGFIVVSCTDFMDNNVLEQTQTYFVKEVDVPAHIPSKDFDPQKPMNSLYQKVGQIIKYPKAARLNNVTGYIVAEYEINSDGELTNLTFDEPFGTKANPKYPNNENIVIDEVVVVGYGLEKNETLPETYLTVRDPLSERVIFNEEIRRVLGQVTWNPAIKDGKPVPVKQHLAIRFQLQ